DPPEHAAGEVVLHLPPGEGSPPFRATVRGEPPRLELLLGDEVTVEVTSDTVRVEAGEARAVVEAGGGGRAELAVGDATFSVNGRGDVEVSTSGAFKVSATEIDLKASGKASITGAEVELN